MWIAEILPSALLLAFAALITALGGVTSTILAARRARGDEQAACEEKLRALRLEAGNLAQEVYELKLRLSR